MIFPNNWRCSKQAKEPRMPCVKTRRQICPLKDRNHGPLSSLLFMQIQRVQAGLIDHNGSRDATAAISPTSPRSQPRQRQPSLLCSLDKRQVGQNFGSQSPPATQQSAWWARLPLATDPQLCAAQPQDDAEAARLQ